MLRAWVQFLVGKLGSHRPHSRATINKYWFVKKKKVCLNKEIKNKDNKKKGVGGRFKRVGTCVCLWLTHVDIWQKPIQDCKAIILQFKINLKTKISYTSRNIIQQEKNSPSYLSSPPSFQKPVETMTQKLSVKPAKAYGAHNKAEARHSSVISEAKKAVLRRAGTRAPFAFLLSKSEPSR